MQGFSRSSFQLFPFVWSFFYYRSSSWRINMGAHQWFVSFFNCSSRFLSELRSAKLYSKINMVFNTCFILSSWSILHLAFLKCISSNLIFWGGVMSLLTISFMFHDSYVVKNDIFKSIILSSFKRSFQPINLSVGVVLGYISPIAFHWECCYLWCLSLIQAFSISFSVKEVFISSLISNKQLFFR